MNIALCWSCMSFLTSGCHSVFCRRSAYEVFVLLIIRPPSANKWVITLRMLHARVFSLDVIHPTFVSNVGVEPQEGGDALGHTAG